MAPSPPPYELPQNFPAALLRGFLGKCPRCGEGKLFRAWLKPKDHCPSCALDLREQRSDDFPAYVAIFITGHVLAPILIMLVLDFDLSILALTAIVFALAVAMLLALIPFGQSRLTIASSAAGHCFDSLAGMGSPDVWMQNRASHWPALRSGS